ncbi:hypothetical protein Hypma_000420 [Hypsizygus marmoreus]|uniref:Uncharacterized protein n=1 Tax=Hypsizygus marmoreus TaxID=39966 RepID=A0A369J8Y3_HYPMA|nr:hypothetical protein Hypma_000420 [Hypsizygus marmoreus]
MAPHATSPDASLPRKYWGEVRAPAEPLPNELLCAILKYAFVSARTEISGSDGYRRSGRLLKRVHYIPEETPIDTIWTATDNLANPFLFPRNVACVSAHWRTIAESLPMLWTRIVLCVDSRPTPFSAVRAALEHSKDLPLDIIVSRRPGMFVDADPDEYERCRAVIELLKPHIHRCRNMTFDVIHSSSFPSISDDFHGAACHMKTLKLKCRINDGTRPGGPACTPAHNAEPFFAQRLEEIIMDGRNFAHACVKIPKFAASLHLAKSLEIYDFTPNPTVPGDDAFKLWDFVSVLSKMRLEALTLTRVYFPFSLADVPNPEPCFGATTLTLDTLAGDFTTQILDSSDFANLHITRCPVSGVAFDTYARNMTLCEIPAFEDMCVFLACWNGQHLEVIDCPAFDDRALAGLAAGNQARGVRELHIRDCTRYRMEMLRTVVTALNERAVQYFHDYLEAEGWDDPPLALETLKVTGRGPVGTEEDICWLRGHTDDFTWTAIQEGEA